MSKGSKNKASTNEKRNAGINSGAKSPAKEHFGKSSEGYLLQMSHAPRIEEASSVFQMLPVFFFTAIIIMITRMHSYERPMDQFFWSVGESKLTDFFSYYKMVAILICAAAVLIFLLYRIFIQAFYIKRSFAYIPMIVYSVFVLLSYSFSDYKLFALWGWNDRFEGTLVLLSYMILLFFVINTVNSEKNVRWLVYVLAAVSTLLGLLGLTQALDKDFFQTTIGKKLITPSWFWDQVDNLNFTFQNKEIYQTVYNINYVSFYLTLLLPLFGLLFIHSVMRGKDEPLYKKLLWGALFALTLYNLIGSASSGGLMGMAFVVVIALIVLNRNILLWKKPVIILLLVTVAISGISYQRWATELSAAVDGVLGVQAESRIEKNKVYHKLDYIETVKNDIIVCYNGEELVFSTYPDDPAAITISDSKENLIGLEPVENNKNTFRINDKRFDWITVRPAVDENENHYVFIRTDEQDWPFIVADTGVKYLTGTKKLVDLVKVPAVGWEDNQSFGTGRGYIWSRTIPMLKETVVLGHGADTYCIYYPHHDYVGKYNSGAFSSKMNVVVDKPHNMYFGYMIGTGIISVVVLLVLWGIYIVQSFAIYRRKSYSDFLSFAGAGIFLGILGFLVSALVNDSTVSVMPMFYGLLGTGIAINTMLKRKQI
jgi:O-antigen ligase